MEFFQPGLGSILGLLTVYKPFKPNCKEECQVRLIKDFYDYNRKKLSLYRNN